MSRWTRLSAAGAGIAAGLVLTGALARNRPFVPEHLGDGEFIDTPEGRVYHRAVGQGPAVVMLPGFAGNSFTWQDVTLTLSKRHLVHWIDPLGYGLSDKPRGADFGAAAQVRRLATLVPSIAPGRIAVVANSAGCQTAVALAAEQPDLVAGLVLVDPFLTAGWFVRNGVALIRRFPRATGLVTRNLWRNRWFGWIAASFGHRHARDVVAESVRRHALTLRTPGFSDAVPALLAGIDPSACDGYIARVTCPTLLIWGSGDRTASPVLARRLAARFARAEFVLMDDVGHLPHEEQPDRLAALIGPFLASLSL